VTLEIVAVEFFKIFAAWSLWRGSFIRLALVVDAPSPVIEIAADRDPFVAQLANVMFSEVLIPTFDLWKEVAGAAGSSFWSFMVICSKRASKVCASTAIVRERR
jgi:hypothetical protein